MTTTANEVFRITNSNGLTGPVWREDYPSYPAAIRALMDAMGWDGCAFLSVAFCADSATESRGEVYARCAYPTQEALDADHEGASAPRVIWWTPKPVTPDDILRLRGEAGEAGDLEQAGLCDLAMRDERGQCDEDRSAIFFARDKCERVIRDNRARQEG